MKKAKTTKNKSKIVWHISFKHGLEAGFVRGQEVGAAKRDDIIRGYQSGKSRGSAFVLAKKQVAAGRSIGDGYQSGKRHGHIIGSAGRAKLSKARAATTTRGHQAIARRSAWYAEWHDHKHHQKFHAAAAGFHGLVYVVIGLVVFISAIGPARAYNTWQQTDWSGGVGSSTTNQYSAANNVVTSTTGQITLDTATISDWCNNASCDAMWVKRKRVGINNAGSAGSNIVVKLDVAYDSDMQTDFDDLRFTATDGTELPYFVKSKTNSVSAEVYIKVNSLVNGTNSIQMYYGNVAASSNSSSNVFDIYDDFSGGSLDGSKWTGGSGVTVSGGKANFSASAQINSQFQGDFSSSRVWQWDVNIPNWCDQSMPSFNMGLGNFDYFETNSGGCGSGVGKYSLRVHDDQSGNNSGITDLNNIVSDTTRTYKIVTKDDKSAEYYYSTNGGASFTKLSVPSYSGSSATQAGMKFYTGLGASGTVMEVDNVVSYPTADTTSAVGIEESQGGKSGNLTSAIFDAGVNAVYGNVSWNASGSGITGVAVRTSNDSGMSGAINFSGCTLLSNGAAISASNCVAVGERYLQYRVYLSDGASSTLNLADISLEHDNDNLPPTSGASNIQMTNAGQNIADGGATKGDNIAFSWTAGTDNPGGSGAAYCIYIGSDQSADPMTTSGDHNNSGSLCPYYITENSANIGEDSYHIGTGQKYFKIKTIDKFGNQYAGQPQLFSFYKDNEQPYPVFNISTPQTWVNSKIFNLSWTGFDVGGVIYPSDGQSGLAGAQYCITNLDLGFGGCEANDPNWFGASHTGALNDVIPANQAGSGSFMTVAADATRIKDNGQSVIFIRAVDNAGNVRIQDGLFGTVSYSTTPPTTPQNLNVSPSTNTSNNFSFSWNAPATYIGQASGINYCWSVNALPAANTCTFAGAGITSLSAGAYATQPGLNTMYIVARDEAGNIDYNNRASVNFTANTAAPGAPRTLSVVDASVKDTADWKLALSWATPLLAGSGVHHYDVYRSQDNLSFAKVGSTTATSFVDAGLSQFNYYYYVKACDNAYNCGAASNTDDELPTGRFTSPAALTSGPESSDVSTRKAKISWSTDRTSDSKVQLGTKSGQYDPDQVANSAQVTGHAINLTNLRPGTNYYYKVQWTDRDGNIGSSGEKSFTTLPAPSCRDVVASRIGLSEATLQLTCRDSAKLKVLYGKSEQFGGQVVVNTSTTESTYNVPLTGLDDGTKYSYKLNTFDSDGNEYEGAVTFSFTTPARPRISNLRFQTVDGEPTSTQKVTWTTNVPSNSGLNYGKSGTAGKDVADSQQVTEHEVIIRELEDNSEYFLVATSRDGSGNIATSDRQVFHTALDTRPPKITKVTIEPSVKGSGVDARGQLIVSWHTDEPATSQVSFDDGKGGTTSRTNEDAALVTDHVVVVSDLSPAQVYSVIATSRDKASNSVQSTTQSAIVGRASDSIFAIIFNALQQIFGLSSK